SSRLSMSCDLSVMMAQFLRRAGESQASSLFQPSTLATMNFGWTYSLTRRTQVGGTYMLGRIYSATAPRYMTSWTGSISRDSGRHWFVQAEGGAGLARAVGPELAPEPPPVSYGGAIGYKAYAYTVGFVYDHSFRASAVTAGGDIFRSATATWSW